MLELVDIHLFIKKNSKIISSSIQYEDEGDIHNYKVNINGLDYELKIIDTYENIYLDIDNQIYKDDNEIQLKLFDIFNYKNVEYFDCYIKNKINDYYDIYNDDYDNIKDKLICYRTITKNNKLIKFTFEYYNNDYYLKINNEIISGFDNIIKKIDSIIL